MSKIEIRPMEPEDWSAVSRIYLEGIATEHATFQTTCPPYSAWDASHAKECRLVLLADGVIAGWTALRRVDPRWCYRGVAEVSIYVGEQFRGHGLGTAQDRKSTRLNSQSPVPISYAVFCLKKKKWTTT
mgnify:CR=1 FL=1